MKLDPEDLRRLNELGVSPKDIEWQWKALTNEPFFPKLSRPATLNDGILSLNAGDLRKYAQMGAEISDEQKIRFIPASGAASRMFKDLKFFLYGKKEDVEDKVKTFINNIENFPFYEVLRNKAEKDDIDLTDPEMTLDFMLNPSGLNYGSTPKAFIPFHSYGKGVKNALEEHLDECSFVFKDTINVHLSFKKIFFQEAERIIKSRSENLKKKIKYGFSEQYESTDTIALDMESGDLARKSDGALLTRPGGHGALIANVFKLDEDYVMIKNIDNVPREKYREERVFHQNVLLGICDYLVRETGRLSELLKKGHMTEAYGLKKKLEYWLPVKDDMDFHFLKRPLRVAGVVKNEGEPGGGPFWVEDDSGTYLQIIEKQQVSPEQKDLVKKSTHFNPVDLVIYKKDAYGVPVGPNDFIDHDQYMLAEKSYEGRKIKALERPGLWNGSMAYYNTVFIEIPVEIFAPVKTVFDLLKPKHFVPSSD